MSALVCLSLGTSSEHVCRCLRELDAKREMAEIRVDLLSDPENLALCFSTANTLGIKTIGTVRDELGFTQQRRERVLACLAAKCTYVDIEVEAPLEYQQELVQQAKQSGVIVIISHHNYAVEESSSQGLAEVVRECFEKGAEVAKVAVAVCSTQGASRVLAVYAGEYENMQEVVAIGMGELGKVTRVSCLALGSPFSFASWDASSATAPGQLTRADMHAALALIGGSSEQHADKKIKA